MESTAERSGRLQRPTCCEKLEQASRPIQYLSLLQSNPPRRTSILLRTSVTLSLTLSSSNVLVLSSQPSTRVPSRRPRGATPTHPGPRRACRTSPLDPSKRGNLDAPPSGRSLSRSGSTNKRLVSAAGAPANKPVAPGPLHLSRTSLKRPWPLPPFFRSFPRRHARSQHA